MTESEQLQQYLLSQYGALGNILIKDTSAPSGIRPWRTRDSRNLAKWLNQTDEPSPKNTPAPTGPGYDKRVCHNLNQAAALTGVGVHTVQAWLAKADNPLPHIRHNQRIIIPHFMLISWLRAESLRTIASQPNSPDADRENHAGAPDTADAGETIKPS